jgi:hypothetical protein
MQLGLFVPKDEVQLCEACRREIAVGDSFCKDSTQSAKPKGQPIEVDIKIYHEECCNENRD